MVAISGASGVCYAKRLLEVLPRMYDRIYLSASDSAINIVRRELDVDSLDQIIPDENKSKIMTISYTDLHAPPASGSHDYDGLVIIPCSMGMLGRIAGGVSDDLITRSADVCLKERRKLVLVARETPLSLIHLRNMAALTEAGAIVLPAAPAFYGKPQKIDDLVDFIVDRVLRSLGLSLRLLKGWGNDS